MNNYFFRDAQPDLISLRYSCRLLEYIRKSARVVEWAALEMRCTGNGTGGSNPSSSAKIILKL